MSFSHTPEGFRKNFIRTVQQRGGSKLFSTTDRTDKSKAEQTTVLREYLDTRPSVHVASLQTKTGKLFVYPVAGEETYNAVNKPDRTTLKDLETEVKETLQQIKIDISETSGKRLEDKEWWMSVVDKYNTNDICVVHSVLADEKDPGMVTLATKIYNDSRMDIVEFKNDVKTHNMSVGVGKFLIKWLTDVENAIKVGSITILDVIRNIDPYLATVMLENLNIVPVNNRYPLSEAKVYWEPEINLCLSTYPEIATSDDEEKNFAKAVKILANVSNMYNGVESFADFEEKRSNLVLHNGHTPANQRTMSVVDNIEDKLDQLLSEVDRTSAHVNSVLSLDNIQFVRLIQTLATGQRGGQLSPLLPSSQVNLIGGKAVLFTNVVDLLNASLARSGKQMSIGSKNKVNHLATQFTNKEAELVQELLDAKINNRSLEQNQELHHKVRGYFVDMSRFTDLLRQIKSAVHGH